MFAIHFALHLYFSCRLSRDAEYLSGPAELCPTLRPKQSLDFARDGEQSRTVHRRLKVIVEKVTVEINILFFVLFIFNGKVAEIIVGVL